MAKPNEVWTAYYDAFAYFSPEQVREGCHPRIMLRDGASKSVVLVHGLTDSPYFMTAIAEHFHSELGYDVYMPLLHFHGLKDPMGMEGVEMEEWKANVRFAIREASKTTDDVSIGGLSTGGVLSFYMACTKPRVTGDLFLFSAALDLAGGPMGLRGELMERLLRSFLAGLIDTDAPLIGDNPYRYGRMDTDGARELARLIKETDDLLDGFDPKRPFPKRVFAAHSEADTTADIDGIKALGKRCSADRFTAFIIPKAEAVSHASLVLRSPVVSPAGQELEAANPKFDEMMRAVSEFVAER